LRRKSFFMYKLVIIILAVSISFIFSGCIRSQPDAVEIDFADAYEGVEYSETNNDNQATLRVAIATVISPRESFAYYKDLFEFLSKRLSTKIEFKQSMSYQEVNDMLAQNLVDMAFICSGAYVVGSDYFELLVVPVVNGLPYYRGYVITNNASNIFRFEDFQGRSFTYSDPLCFTGKLYIDTRLMDMGTTAEEFFGEVKFSMSHDISIQMVSRNLVDGASINGLIFEYMAEYHPDHVNRIRIIEKSGFNGIPPIVNSLLMPRDLREEIQSFLLNMHETQEGRKILDKLLIDQFILGSDTLYQGLREAKNIYEPV
jgi:phosphonate transport system substrate-binding protein